MIRVPWKYCECGCHGSNAAVGGVHLSRSVRFGKEVLSLSGEREERGYPTRAELDAALEARLRRLLDERRAQVAELEALLAVP